MLEVVHQQVLGELDWKSWMRTVQETALVPCHNCTLRVLMAFKAGLKTASPRIMLSCCMTQLT